MKHKLTNWIAGANARRNSFRSVFILMYYLLIFGVTYVLNVSAGQGLFTIENVSLILLYIALVGLVWLEEEYFQNNPPRRAALMLFVARILLVEGIVYVSSNIISVLLYPIIPFHAYFAFGALISYLLSFITIALTFFKVVNDTSTFYIEQYPALLFTVFIFLLIFTQVMARIIRQDELSRTRTERLLHDLQASHLRLQHYAQQVADLAATEERNRLARDIHDSLGHYLTAVTIQLEKALAFKERDPVMSEQAIIDAKQAAHEALHDVRRSVSALRDTDQVFSLSLALTELVAGMDNQGLDNQELGNGRFQITLKINGEESGSNRAVLMALYRATQEGLTNVQKYASAKHVNIDLDFGSEEIKLRLQDDGVGFDTAVLQNMASSPHANFGLQGLRERLELVRGQLLVTSKPGHGTTLTVIVPKDPVSLERDSWQQA